MVIDGPPFACPEDGCGFGFLKVQATELHLWQKHQKRQILIAPSDDHEVAADQSDYSIDDVQQQGGESFGDLVKAATALENLYGTPSASINQNDEEDSPTTPDDDDFIAQGGRYKGNFRRKRGRQTERSRSRTNSRRPSRSLTSFDPCDFNSNSGTTSTTDALYSSTTTSMLDTTSPSNGSTQRAHAQQQQQGLLSTASTSYTNRDRSDSRRVERPPSSNVVRRSSRRPSSRKGDIDSS
jgi:hypothetical protein